MTTRARAKNTGRNNWWYLRFLRTSNRKARKIFSAFTLCFPRYEEGAAVELSDEADYGDGEASFKEALARERQVKAKRDEKINARVIELQNKEKERQENMLKMLGRRFQSLRGKQIRILTTIPLFYSSTYLPFNFKFHFYKYI